VGVSVVQGFKVKFLKAWKSSWNRVVYC